MFHHALFQVLSVFRPSYIVTEQSIDSPKISTCSRATCCEKSAVSACRPQLSLLKLHAADVPFARIRYELSGMVLASGRIGVDFRRGIGIRSLLPLL
jgi:hypothetical protein